MSFSKDNRIVVVGAGHAGGSAVAALRQFGHEGPITLIGEEPFPPYQRPPLSKGYLKGELAKERLYLKPLSFYQNKNIELMLGEYVEAIALEEKRVQLRSGKAVTYDVLILATGSRPRRLQANGADLTGVQLLRGLADVDRLRARAKPGKKLVVIGAGYIGLEAAAVARQLGLEVTVLEAADRVLARVTGSTISSFYQDVHRGHGVDLRLGAQVKGFSGNGDELAGVQLATGEILPADIALVGIGILPNQEIAEAAGIACQDGIITDLDALTSDPSVFAIGDCTRRPLIQYDRQGRLESVHNALEQAKAAAAAICSQPRVTSDTPWFWSDQYDLKLQTAGLSNGFDETVVRGDIADRKFSVWYLKKGILLAVDAVNSPLEFLCAKKMVGTRILDPASLKDEKIDIKVLMAIALEMVSD